MTRGELEPLQEKIDITLRDGLMEHQPGYHDAIDGFKDAWELVRGVIAEEMAKCN